MSFTYTIYEPTFTDVEYSVASDKPLTFAEAYAQRGEFRSYVFENPLDDVPVQVYQTDTETGKETRLFPKHPALTRLLTEYSIDTINIRDCEGERIELDCYNGDDCSLVADDEDNKTLYDGVCAVLTEKLGQYEEAFGRLTFDEDGCFDFVGSVRKQVSV
jgi:hypothetical protein